MSSGFPFGSANNKGDQEKTSEITTGITFGSVNDKEKSREKFPEMPSSFFFDSVNRKERDQEKMPEITTGITFGSVNDKEKSREKTPEITTGITFGSVNDKEKSREKLPEMSSGFSFGSVTRKERDQEMRSQSSIGFTFGSLNKKENVQGVDELLRGLEELLNSGKCSDVIINVQGKHFNAHKNILAIWSPVLSAMIEHKTLEKTTGMIKIDDCEPDAFSDFLHFLYTGSTTKIKADNVLDLYTIADKYQVPRLCKICVNYLRCNINLRNFCDVLTLSLLHNEDELIHVATQFFVKNSTAIAETVKWGLFLAENPVEANELFLTALRFYTKK